MAATGSVERSVKAAAVSRELRALAKPETAQHSQRFFKTGKGEYGEGDKFLGIRVPIIRARVKKFESISLDQSVKLLASKFHEERLCAVLMLVDQYSRANDEQKKRIYQAYLNNTRYINSWDLVDSSAHKIVGPWLQDRSRKPLFDLAVSTSLWERRISLISTFHYIRQNDFADALALSELMLDDGEGLIHKAVGWMLREVGNRDKKVEREFLADHYKSMPRTMLRYAIEKFPQPERKRYLAGLV